MSTETIRATRDGQPRTATSTLTQLLSSGWWDDDVGLNVVSCRADILGTKGLVGSM